MSNENIEGMVVGDTGKYAVMVDKANDHYGWLFYKHPDGGWVSARKAMAVELEAAEHVYRFSLAFSGAKPKQALSVIPLPPERPSAAQEELTALLRDVYESAGFERACDNDPAEALISGARRDSDEWNRKALAALQAHLMENPFLVEGF